MKRIRTILVFLLLGTIVNLLLSWTLVAWHPRPTLLKVHPIYVRTDQTPMCWFYSREDSFGTTLIDGSATQNSLNMNEFKIEPVPHWSLLNREPVERRDHVTWRVQEDARGWPLRSFLARYVNEPRFIYDSHLNVFDGIPVYRVNTPYFMDREFIALPLTPIWPGFIVNPVIHAVLIYFGCKMLAIGFHWNRARRQLCPTCAYDLRGADHESCPECGTGVRKHRHA